MTLEQAQADVARLQAHRQWLREVDAGPAALELNRMRLVGATHALNSLLVARYCETVLHPLTATLVSDDPALD